MRTHRLVLVSSMLLAGHVLVTTPIYVSSADLDFRPYGPFYVAPSLAFAASVVLAGVWRTRTADPLPGRALVAGSTGYLALNILPFVMSMTSSTTKFGIHTGAACAVAITCAAATGLDLRVRRRKQAPSSATRDIVRRLWLLVAVLVPVALGGSLGAGMESTGPYEELSAESLVPLALLACVLACALGVAFVAFMRQVRPREERTARSRAWLAVAVVAGTAFLVLAPIGRELGQRDRGIAMDRARNNRAPETSPWSVTFHIVFGGWCILATGGGFALARSMPPGRAA